MNRYITFDVMRNGKAVAQGVVLESGRCVISWPTSVIVYDSEKAARDVHITHMGGRGEKTYFEADHSNVPGFGRGVTEAYQDRCENIPLKSIGKDRKNPVAPEYIPPDEKEGWLLGYIWQAALMYGEDWRDAEFIWAPTMKIGGGRGNG